MTKPQDQSQSLEEAGTLFKKVASELYWAAQAAQDGNESSRDKHLDWAMQYQEQAQLLLNEL